MRTVTSVLPDPKDARALCYVISILSTNSGQATFNKLSTHVMDLAAPYTTASNQSQCIVGLLVGTARCPGVLKTRAGCRRNAYARLSIEKDVEIDRADEGLRRARNLGGYSFLLSAEISLSPECMPK